MREIIFHMNGEQTENETDFTMQSLYETLESEISNVNRKLNLVK